MQYRKEIISKSHQNHIDIRLKTIWKPYSGPTSQDWDKISEIRQYATSYEDNVKIILKPYWKLGQNPILGNILGLGVLMKTGHSKKSAARSESRPHIRSHFIAHILSHTNPWRIDLVFYMVSHSFIWCHIVCIWHVEKQMEKMKNMDLAFLFFHFVFQLGLNWKPIKSQMDLVFFFF